MKTILIVFLGSVLFFDASSQELVKRENQFRGITPYIEVHGAAIGHTVNVDKVIMTPFRRWHGSVRLGFGMHKRDQGRVPYKGVPLQINFFKGHNGHHQEIGASIAYVQSARYIVFTNDVVSGSESVLFSPSVGYRYQKPGGSVFLKLTYIPFLTLKEYSKERAFTESVGAWTHCVGISAGYFIARR